MGTVRLAFFIAAGFACVFASTGTVDAHIGVTPGLLVTDDTQTLSLSVHNDLDRPMTGLAVTAPDGTRIGLADSDGRWQGVVEGRTATWTGGPLAPNTGTTFGIDVTVEAATALGPIELQAAQLYRGGGSLPWQISVTVVPAEDESQLLTWAIVGGAALLATSGIALIALRRRGRSLQER